MLSCLKFDSSLLPQLVIREKSQSLLFLLTKGISTWKNGNITNALLAATLINNNIYKATIFAHVSINVAWVTFMESLCSDAAWERGIYSACWGCGQGSPAVVLCSQFYLGTNRS